ncbi:AMP-binding protein [Williamsia sp. MIQD14]|uniref:AMP-binding protein n=1 Tax=Williamsia sp. MIQD14 TaxID=3425703 RepID=UPI003DA08208
MTADLDPGPQTVSDGRGLLTDFVTRWAQERPDAAAITYGDTSWTWEQWDLRIRRLTGALRSAGIGRGDTVAFVDKNHPACLEVTFAVAALGAAVTIVNWRQAGDELVHVLVDSGSTLVIAGAEFAESVGAVADRTPAVTRTLVVGGDAGADDYETFLASGEPTSAGADVTDTDTLLVIYSSGTTGRPKGVVLDQHALITHTVDNGDVFPYAEGDISLVAMPLFHVGGISYAFIGIRAGVPSIMTREPDAASLVGAFVAGATHAFFVPPVLAGFLAAGDGAIGAFAKLRFVGYGAAPMPLPLLQRALNAWPHIDFVQVYGQTEIAGVATVLRPEVHRDPAREHLLVSVGNALPGVEIRVVDVVTGEDVPAGEEGEIWLRTAHAMTGYLNRPDATAETITPEGWLRTGDIGRMDADGYVFVDDRIKDMIITGGENVYGPEVERVLMEHPSVTDAAVIGVPDERWGESVKAVVAVSTPIDAEEVIAFCRTRLAGYKCPRTVDVIDALPRNPSGKILKRELRAPFWEGQGRRV